MSKEEKIQTDSEVFVDQNGLSDGIFSPREWDFIVRHLNLTPKQTAIIRHLFLGLNDREIAEKNRITVFTVRTHLNRLFNRFKVQDRNELIIFVFKQFRSNYPIADHNTTSTSDVAIV